MQCRFSMDVIKCDIICFVKKCGGKHSYMFKNVKVSKKRIFYSLADRKGGGGWSLVSPFGPDRKQMWEFWPLFSIEMWFFDTQNTSHVQWGDSRMHFACPLRLHLSLSHHFVTEQQQTVRDCRSWMKMTFFLCYRTHMIITSNKKHTKKIHEKLTVRGGG